MSRSLFAMPASLLSLATATLLSLAGLGSAASTEEWRGRAIYQVMTDRFEPALNAPFYHGNCYTDLGNYCGGTWNGIKEKLDYIQGMNFDAIWVSPVVAQLPQVTKDGSSYAGYWQQDLYTLNSHFGTLEDLHALIEEVHKRGMFFMLDVVMNHMAYSGNVSSIDYSILNPFNDEKYYHSYCPIDYSNQTSLENCWLGSEDVPLADLNTQMDEVQDMFKDWIKGMAANHSIDGLRIDAAANMQPDFFPGFMEAADMFATAEVYLDDEDRACQWLGKIPSIVNYPLYWHITGGFAETSGDMGSLVKKIATEKEICSDTTLFATFSENHDVPRFANHTQDVVRAMNVNAFVIMFDGVPIVYQGQEQHFTGGTDPYTNREALWQSGFNIFHPLYVDIAALNQIRHHAFDTQGEKYGKSLTTVLDDGDHHIVLEKGEKGKEILTILNNYGQDAEDFSVDFKSNYTSGSSLTNILTCDTVSVGDDGAVELTVTGGLPVVLFGTDLLKGSNLCGTDGERWHGDANITSTVTTHSAYTTTIGGQATEATATAILPVVTQAEAAAGPQITTESASALAVSVPVQPMMAGVIPAIAVVLTSGLMGAMLGYAV